MLGLCSNIWAFSICSEGGNSLVVVRVCAKSLQLCSALCDPMNCSLQAPLSMGILQVKIMEWVTALLQGIFPTQASNPRISCLLHWQACSLPPEPPETLVVVSRGLLSSCGGFSLRWPLLLQNTGSRARTSVLGHMGLVALQLVGSSQTGD